MHYFNEELSLDFFSLQVVQVAMVFVNRCALFCRAWYMCSNTMRQNFWAFLNEFNTCGAFSGNQCIFKVGSPPVSAFFRASVFHQTRNSLQSNPLQGTFNLCLCPPPTPSLCFITHCTLPHPPRAFLLALAFLLPPFPLSFKHLRLVHKPIKHLWRSPNIWLGFPTKGHFCDPCWLYATALYFIWCTLSARGYPMPMIIAENRALPLK